MVARALVTALAVCVALAACTGPRHADSARPPDWLVDPSPYTATIAHDAAADELVLDNGLVRRTLRLSPNAATVAYDDLMTGAAILRAVKPEAEVTLDGVTYPIGGLVGQPEASYLLPEWVDAMAADPEAFQLVDWSEGPIAERFVWRRTRPAEDRPWPPPGRELQLHFAAPAGSAHAGVTITVHAAIYDGLPLVAKWLQLTNGTGRTVRVDAYVSDLLAAVEGESDVEGPSRWRLPDLHVETDYAHGGFAPKSAESAARWVPDPDHLSQVNYARQTPNLLVSSPELGPAIDLIPGETFRSHRTWQLVHDGGDRERRGLALRRMYRTIAPWVTENPLLMHVRSADPDAVRRAIDQCAEVGFEMVILTFGSGFDMEDVGTENLARWRELAAYAHERGVQLGGYSLLSSRSISELDDVVGPAKFGHAPCLQSAWGNAYFQKLYTFFMETGFDLLEHDGSYPGDPCASTDHPGHRDLEDSVWRQREQIVQFYRWARGRGISLNVPDWYFLNGTTKSGMGYRETNWSLPREQQIVLGRQNIHDGTWTKTPSMGWMFVPLVEYHGGGAAATLEPLDEHRDAYGAHLANNLSAGVQACYRGPRLYDTDEVRDLVAGWVAWFKRHRAILESDVIHVRRPDGRDLDALLHVNPQLPTRGLLVVHNPTDAPLERTLRVPLYYTGLTDRARVVRGAGPPFDASGNGTPVGAADEQILPLDREYELELDVEVPPHGMAWWTFQAP